MKNLVRSRNFYVMILFDAVLVFAAYYLAYYLRFDGSIPAGYLAVFYKTVAMIVVMKLLIFLVIGLYRGMWRFTSLNDLRSVVAAVLLSTMLVTMYFVFLFHFQGFPRSVLAIDGILSLLFIGGIRVSVRLILNRGSGLSYESMWGVDRNRKRVMIIGAGNTGEKVVREMMDSPAMNMRPVGFLDDAHGKWGKSIHGVPVHGGIDDIGKFQKDFDEILIAIPSVQGQQMRRIVAACDKTGKRFRIMPSISELVGGQVTIKAIRDVRYEDLLGRDVVSLDSELLNRMYRGKRILITGAGGSIGSELVRQMAQYQPAALGLLDFSEYNLFQVENACRRQFEYIPIEAYLVDIRVDRSVRRAFKAFKPDVVLHAAAYKHVPLQELNPREAIFNNVKGTRHLVNIAGENGVERFVLVSTDKAVRPTNVMGATKRVAEMFVECMNIGRCCRFMAVRFGNVLGSSGSVIPIFNEQIAQGLPVTVTHPEVTRYFMSTSEAAQLILQAGAMGEGGEIFILDMGQPVNIADMARDLIRLHGLEPERDIPVRFVGLRPGEKLYEELITEGEGIMPTSHEKIRVIRGRHTDRATLNILIDELIACAETHDPTAIKQKLHQIVPEYTPPLIRDTPLFFLSIFLIDPSSLRHNYG